MSDRIDGVQFNRYLSANSRNNFASAGGNSVDIGKYLAGGGGYSSFGVNPMNMMMQMFQMQMMFKMMGVDSGDMFGDLFGKKTERGSGDDNEKIKNENASLLEKVEELEKKLENSSKPAVVSNDIKKDKLYKVADGGENLRDLVKKELGLDGMDDKNLTSSQKEAIRKEQERLCALNQKDIKEKIKDDVTLDNLKVEGGHKLLMENAESKRAPTEADEKADSEALKGYNKMKNGKYYDIKSSTEVENITSEYNKTGKLEKEFVFNKTDKKVYYKYNGEKIPCETKINDDGSYTVAWKDESKNLSFERTFDKIGIPLTEKTKIGDKKTGAEIKSIDLNDAKNIIVDHQKTGTVITEKDNSGEILNKFIVSDKGNYEFVEGAKNKGILMPKGYNTPEGVERIIKKTNSNGDIICFYLDENYNVKSKKIFKVGKEGEVIADQKLTDSVDEQRAEIEAKIKAGKFS